jgi:hypothetical protein
MLLCMTGCGSDKPNDVNPVSATADEVKITTTAETAAAIPQIDCFEGVEIMLSGISPNGKLTLNKENASQDIRKFVSFSADLSSGIHNGDTIIVTASYDDGMVRYQQTKEITANLPTYLTIEDVRNGAELKLSTEDETEIHVKLENGVNDDKFQFLGADSENWSDFICADFNSVESIELDKIYYAQYDKGLYVHYFYTINTKYDVDFNHTNAQRLKTNMYDAEKRMDYYYYKLDVPVSEEYTGESTVSYPLVGHIVIATPLLIDGKVTAEEADIVYSKVVNPYVLNNGLNPLPGYDVFDEVDVTTMYGNYPRSAGFTELIDYIEITR